MATVVAAPSELWSEFDDELDAMIEGNKQAEKSYTEGRGMSLASIAVGSAAMRLTKVLACTRAMIRHMWGDSPCSGVRFSRPSCGGIKLLDQSHDTAEI